MTSKMDRKYTALVEVWLPVSAHDCMREKGKGRETRNRVGPFALSVGYANLLTPLCAFGSHVNCQGAFFLLVQVFILKIML